MGSFWGMDNAGKEAEGFPREYGAYSSARFKNWLPRSDDNYSGGKGAYDAYGAYNQGRMNDGFGSIATMRDYGSQIMPGVTDYIGNKSGRINQIIDNYNTKVPTAGQTMGKVNQYLDESGDIIRSNRDYALTDIGDTYNRDMGYEDAAHGGMDKAYQSSLSEVEKLKPGSQFQQAEVARSFAGQNAAMAGRMRRSGMDMNSPEAMAFMQRGGLAQGRAMDERAAAGTKDYVSAKSGLMLGQGQEGVRHSGAQTGLDMDRSNRAIGVQDKTTDRALNWEGQRGQAALMDKALNTQDWQTNSDLQRELSAADLEGIGLRRDEYNAGMGYNSADLNERNRAAGELGNYGRGSMDYSLRADQMANQWGNTGMNAYGTAYGYEAPKAGWGAKMLAGIAGAGLNMVAPGAGSALTGAVGSAYGAPGGGGTGGWQNLFSTFMPKGNSSGGGGNAYGGSKYIPW